MRSSKSSYDGRDQIHLLIPEDLCQVSDWVDKFCNRGSINPADDVKERVLFSGYIGITEESLGKSLIMRGTI